MRRIYEEWWRWRPPLLLISLKKLIIYLNLPPNLPPNVRLMQESDCEEISGGYLQGLGGNNQIIKELKVTMGSYPYCRFI